MGQPCGVWHWQQWRGRVGPTHGPVHDRLLAMHCTVSIIRPPVSLLPAFPLPSLHRSWLQVQVLFRYLNDAGKEAATLTYQVQCRPPVNARMHEPLVSKQGPRMNRLRGVATTGTAIDSTP